MTTKPEDRKDVLGRTLNVGDIVAVACPVPYASTGACMRAGRITKHTKHGVTIERLDVKTASWESPAFNTPYRDNKFLVLEGDESIILTKRELSAIMNKSG